MGAEGDRRPDDRPAPVLSVRLDHPLPPLPAGRLVLEDGTALAFDGRLAPDTPTGYHRLEPDGPGVPVRLIVSPGRCPLPARPTLGLVGASSTRPVRRASWGMGDLGDLRRLGRWARRSGPASLLVNPLHAAAPRPAPSRARTSRAAGASQPPLSAQSRRCPARRPAGARRAGAPPAGR